MRERAAGWLKHSTDVTPIRTVEHPAVVLRQMPHGFLVIHGTSTPRNREGRNVESGTPDPDVLVVEPDTPDGEVLGLRNLTYFHRRASRFVRDPGDFRSIGKCSPELFTRLRELVGF